MNNPETLMMIVNDKYNVMIPLEGAKLFKVPFNPHPDRPILAHHNYGEERMEWIKDNKGKGKSLKEDDGE